MTFELTVVFMTTRDNLNNIWNFSLNATLSSIYMICSYSFSSVGNFIEIDIYYAEKEF